MNGHQACCWRYSLHKPGHLSGGVYYLAPPTMEAQVYIIGVVGAALITSSSY